MPRALADLVTEQLDTLVAAVARDQAADPARAGLLVALSGGPDSVALLDVSATWAAAAGRPLVAAHYNHRLRGEAGDRDEVFCQRLCERLTVPLVRGGGDPRGVARQRGRGLEEAARHLRLSFLEAVRGEHDLAAVALGHHRDDQVETVLMRLFRGAGLDGLRGIRPRQDRLIHPLLVVDRAAIVAHLAARGLAWREDASNHDGSNVRGRVRRELLPLARDIFGPGADAGPARLADLAEGDLEHLDGLAEAAWRDCTVTPPPGLEPPALSATAASALPPAIARRVVRRWLGHHLPHDLALAHVRDVRAWLAAGQSGGGLDLPGGLRLVRVFDAVGMAGRLPCAGAADAWRVHAEPLPAIPDPVPPPVGDDDGWRLICAADGLAGRLRLRHPRPGDRLEPFGLGGSKKVSDLAQERRVPAALRPELIVVEDDRGPLWVPGLAQAERTRLLPSTRQAVTIFVTRRRQERRR
jgi:tRNA(Ile)-lysidine synthase